MAETRYSRRQVVEALRAFIQPPCACSRCHAARNIANWLESLPCLESRWEAGKLTAELYRFAPDEVDDER